MGIIKQNMDAESTNIIDLKSIRELLDMKFFIPSYQRGYRWTCQQVKDLLSDIDDFAKNKHKDYEFYCIQPLVVRKMSEKEKEMNDLSVNDTWYEVIDGQQRLITLYLLLLSMKAAAEIMNLPTQKYAIKFQREATKQSNLNLESISNGIDVETKDIDYFHMKEAYDEIDLVCKERNINKGKFMNALLSSELDDSNPTRDKANNVRFIWYESVNEDPVKVFTRLNVGKISLTNSELIKALFLNRSNFKLEGSHFKLRQQEIASEWDSIEYVLQNDEFWLFLNNIGYNRPTRIDFIFDLVCEQNSLELSEESLNRIGNDDYRTFRYFYEYFHADKHDMVHCWNKVKKYYQTFKEWYDDLQLYHYVGYLVACGFKIPNLIAEWNKNDNKQDFVSYLKDEILEKLCKCPSLDSQYKTDGNDKLKCLPILLFHNIQTVINQNCRKQRYDFGSFYKFPFHLYKTEGWDVEHINSNTTNPEEDGDTREEWLLSIYLSVSPEIQEKIKHYFEGNNAEKNKEELFMSIKEQIPKEDEWTPEEKNRLWNYALLDSSTNRSYGNAIFSGKRRVIIGKDKGKYISIPKLREKKLLIGEERDADSSFVPPCTKQVFLKYNSPVMNNPNYWTKIDAECYLKDIENCISQLNDKE